MNDATGFKNILRIGLFKEFDYGSQTALIQLFDRTPGDSMVRCEMPLGSYGIFSYPKKNTRVIVGYGYRERLYVLAILPSSALSQNLSSSSNTKNVSVNDIQYPRLEQGEIAIQGLKNSKLFFKSSGDVSLEFGKSDISFTNKGLYTEDVVSHYQNTEAGRYISGPIKRDLRKVVSEVNKTTNKLSSTEYEQVVSEIGKHPNFRTALVTSNIGSLAIGASVDNTATVETIRNPALVEEHHITYEFARSYMIGTPDEEKDRVFKDTTNKDFLNQPNRRDMARTDVLNLNSSFRNNLIEEVRGTVVDRYGNILDLNRNVINYASIKDKLKDKDIRTSLEDLSLRRSIKYHFEINSRKDDKLGNSSLTVADGPDVKNAHAHSRWFIDVDGEGLTKINIPASSNLGNIPVLSRYLNTSLEQKDNTDSFRDAVNSPPRDVTHMPFGDTSRGISVSGAYLPPKVTKVVTAYHDITSTASAISTPIMATSLSNEAGTQNAGGKSIHLNLDGSMELNVGRDYIDHKSIVIDTSGSIISRIGKDKSSNSVVSQLDGNVAIQVGGDTISNGKSPEESVANPTVKIFIKTANGNFDKIEITEDAIVIESAPNKNIVFKSGNNIVLDAAGQTFIGGEAISFFGSATRDGKTISSERVLARVGNIIA